MPSLEISICRWRTVLWSANNSSPADFFSAAKPRCQNPKHRTAAAWANRGAKRRTCIPPTMSRQHGANGQCYCCKISELHDAQLATAKRYPHNFANEVRSVRGVRFDHYLVRLCRGLAAFSGPARRQYFAGNWSSGKVSFEWRARRVGEEDRHWLRRP